MNTMVKRQYPDKNGDLRWALDRTGCRYGKLEVVRFESFGDREPIWLCRCDCGKEKAIPTQGLRTGRTRSCGCLSVKAVRQGPGMGAAHTRYVQYQRRAKKDGLEFTITEHEFIDMSQKKCRYCGRPPHQAYFNNYSTPFVHNGIDRVDSNKGYTLENCVPSCRRCNQAKNDMGEVEFREWIVLAHDNLPNWEPMTRS